MVFKDVTSTEFVMTGTASAGGTINPTGDITVAAGSDFTWEITPDAGYEIAKIMFDQIEVAVQNTITTRDISAPHSVTVTFEPTNGTGCNGVEAWNANTPWSSYTTGDQSVNDGQVWEVIAPAFAVYEPSIITVIMGGNGFATVTSSSCFH